MLSVDLEKEYYEKPEEKETKCFDRLEVFFDESENEIAIAIREKTTHVDGKEVDNCMVFMVNESGCKELQTFFNHYSKLL